VLCENLTVLNSSATSSASTPEQKVILRYEGLNLGEIEMRNDSPKHYREIRFNMMKPRVMALLYSKIPKTDTYGVHVLVYGNANKHFGRWKK
jgi:hypothetical protein